jgi:hypothetical protein
MQMAQFARLLIALGMVVVAASDAVAQEVSFAELSQAVKPGETVVVTDVSGKTSSGRLISATADGITANVDVPGPGGGGAGWTRRDMRWAATDITRVQREVRDSLWNGAALGGLAGGAAGILLLTQTTGCDCTPGQVAFMFVGPFIGAGIGVGALIDAVTVARHTLYRADGDRRADLRIAPVVGPATRGVRLSIGF